MRLFIALRFDKAMTKTLTLVMHDLKTHGVKGKYVPAQNLHITLTFIGETDQVSAVKDIISAVPVPSMRVSLDKLRMQRDLLLVDIKSNQKLKEYVANVRTALDQAGIDYDHKKFAPHITLVRRASGNFKEVSLPKESMTSGHVSLMKSKCRDGKMVYTEIAGKSL